VTGAAAEAGEEFLYEITETGIPMNGCFVLPGQFVDGIIGGNSSGTRVIQVRIFFLQHIN
jgi:hypothetical protein